MIRQTIGFILVLASCHPLVPGMASAEDGGSLYRDSRLGIEFVLPADWDKRPCPSSEASQCLELRPPSRRDAPDPAITIELKNAGLEETLGRHVLFKKRADGWVKHGRVGENGAVPLTGTGWRGIEASATCGISDELGFHAAAGICYTAILSNGTRCAVIESDGFESTLDTASALSRSLRFLP